MTESVVLITGAAHRIGAALVRAFHEAGYRVLIHCRQQFEKATRLAQELCLNRSDSAKVIQADLSVHEDRAKFVQAIHQMTKRLDVLIHNASAFYPTPITKASEAQWDELMTVNAKAPFFLTQDLAPLLRQECGGHVIFLSDIYGQRPLDNYSLYSVSKAAINMLTLALAKDLGPDIRVNAVAPGAILWPEQDSPSKDYDKILEKVILGRKGDPQDITQTALFLAQSNYITGQIISVDGGRSAYI